MPQRAISSRANCGQRVGREPWLAAHRSRCVAGGALGGGPLSATIATRVEVQPLTQSTGVLAAPSSARAQQALFAAGFCVVATDTYGAQGTPTSSNTVPRPTEAQVDEL